MIGIGHHHRNSCFVYRYAEALMGISPRPQGLCDCGAEPRLCQKCGADNTDAPRGHQICAACAIELPHQENDE